MYQKLLTAENRRKLPPLYSQEHVKDPIVWVKFFTPDSNWTFWATEFDQKDTFFGLVKGHETELGYFSLRELQSIRGGLGLHVERDMHFTPKPLSQVRGSRNPIKLLNSPSVYFDTGKKAGEARVHRDEATAKFHENWYRRARALEQGENKQVADSYFKEGYREGAWKPTSPFRNPFPSVIAKLAGMRKPQDFVVYPASATDDGMITVQSDKAIGRFDPRTGKGVLNWRGSGSKYFMHLSKMMGAEPYQFPMDFVQKSISEQPHSGQRLGGGISVANPSNMYKLRFERSSWPTDDFIGTIRTVPENYYVATVTDRGALQFKGIEGMTQTINQKMVRNWWKAQRNLSNPTLRIPTKSKKQREHLYDAQTSLSKAGVSFDTGMNIGTMERDWELDYSLKGAKLMKGKKVISKNPYEKTKPPYHRKGDRVPDYWELTYTYKQANAIRDKMKNQYPNFRIRILSKPISGRPWVFEGWGLYVKPLQLGKRVKEIPFEQNPNMPAALKARSRYQEDQKAGHGAAEYWRGQAGAFFTGNPLKYHALNEKTGRSFCGIKKSSKNFIFPVNQFLKHYAPEHKCEKCWKGFTSRYGNPGLGIAGAAGSLAARKKINPEVNSMNPHQGQLSTSDIRCPHCHWKPRKGLSFGDSLQQVQKHYFKKHPSDPKNLKHGKNPIGAIAAALGTSVATGAATGAGVGAGLIAARKIITGKAS